MKIREPIRLVIMYSDRLAIKWGRHSYISAWHNMFFFYQGRNKVAIEMTLDSFI